jgi:ubiquitin-like-conjugating enzyme ATG3
LVDREKGDDSKVRDFLPREKQYLVTRGVPCLRRAQSLAYTDADEDAERLVSFGDGPSSGGDGDEWVETHAGRKATANPASDASALADIPDDDDDDISRGVGNMSLGGHGTGEQAVDTPDLDDIPDMEEDDLEEEDTATAVKPKQGGSGAGASGSK